RIGLKSFCSTSTGRKSSAALRGRLEWRRNIIILSLAAITLATATAPLASYWLWWRGNVGGPAGGVDHLPPNGAEPSAQPLNEEQPYRPGTPAYSGPGWELHWSPDLSLAAVNTDVANSFHTINLFDPRTGAVRPIISIRESDPGSGASHRYAWSADSRALFI